MRGNGSALALSGRARALRGDFVDPLDGTGPTVNGPVSKLQPEQPVAAEPTKVGEYLPKLDDLTA